MPIDPKVAAKYLAKLSGWRLSNLPLQKLLYLADMVYTGTSKKRLLAGNFEAWDYGPVHPEVYHHCKYKGAKPLTETTFIGVPDLDENSAEAKFLRAVYDKFGSYTSGQLVRITHAPKSAWYKRYTPGARGVQILTEDMIEEYEKRAKSCND